jgi:GxxExxY protein
MSSDDDSSILYKEESYAIIGAAMEVHGELGHGFFEAVYRRSMMIELPERGIEAEEEKYVPVYYKGHLVGENKLDILAAGKIILELKACKAIVDDHIAQALNYLAATGFRLAIIINFGQRKLEFRRVVR